MCFRGVINHTEDKIYFVTLLAIAINENSVKMPFIFVCFDI